MKFRQVLVLGGGFAGKVAALALHKQDIRVTLVECGLRPSHSLFQDANLAGKFAHSHIFLPRLLRDANQILPQWIQGMEDAGLQFTPGMAMAGNSLPCQRLFATRLQVETTLEQQLDATPDIVRMTDKFNNATLSHGDDKVLTSVMLQKSGPYSVTSDTLIVDAMGGLSPLMKALTDGSAGIIRERSFVCYMTQFFQFTNGRPKGLPDALDRCTWKSKDWYMSLYPAANDWFSVTAVLDARNRTLKADLVRETGLIDLANKHENISRWVQTATPIGSTKVYLDPKNTWFLEPFLTAQMPRNFCAVGDALITTSPVLGAGCSFAVTHVAELIAALVETDWHRYFAQSVASVQSSTFADSLTYEPPDGTTDLPLGVAHKVRAVMRNLPVLSGLRQRKALTLRSTL